jgi:DNA-binding HxlR family transcriptional regulator
MNTNGAIMRKPTQKNKSGKTHKETSPHGLKECPIFLTLSLIANKWSIRILYFLLNAKKHTLRFGELKKQLEGITQRELAKHLRAFEAAGIVTRTVYPEVPPKVEYTLTPLGKSLWKPIDGLSDWAEKNGPSLQKQYFSMLEQ